MTPPTKPSVPWRSSWTTRTPGQNSSWPRGRPVDEGAPASGGCPGGGREAVECRSQPIGGGRQLRGQVLDPGAKTVGLANARIVRQEAENREAGGVLGDEALVVFALHLASP